MVQAKPLCKQMKMNSTTIFIIVAIVCVKALAVAAADDDNGSETTTDFDPSTRGVKKFGDKCEMTKECGFAGSICFQSYCTCSPELMATNHVDKCGKAVSVNESCFFNEQCEDSTPETECRDGRCICRFDKTPIIKKDGSAECIAVKEKDTSPPSGVNPAMFLILGVMALMFIIICVVLRLFSKARWRENRTIFNTPNPRLMNVSLLRDNKLLHGGERRGSRISVRMPSRQPSMNSLRASPNASIGSRRNSSASRISNRSLPHHKSSDHHGNNHTVVNNPNLSELISVNQQQHLQHQLAIHQNNQRRRSSVNHLAAAHHASVPDTNQEENIHDEKVQDLTDVKSET